jgi:hypothetical protein
MSAGAVGWKLTLYCAPASAARSGEAGAAAASMSSKSGQTLICMPSEAGPLTP